MSTIPNQESGKPKTVTTKDSSVTQRVSAGHHERRLKTAKPATMNPSAAKSHSNPKTRAPTSPTSRVSESNLVP